MMGKLLRHLKGMMTIGFGHAGGLVKHEEVKGRLPPFLYFSVTDKPHLTKTRPIKEPHLKAVRGHGPSAGVAASASPRRA